MCGGFVVLKDTVWKLFEETGNLSYYLLYKELTSDGVHNKSNSTKNH